MESKCLDQQESHRVAQLERNNQKRECDRVKEELAEEKESMKSLNSSLCAKKDELDRLLQLSSQIDDKENAIQRMIDVVNSRNEKLKASS